MPPSPSLPISSYPAGTGGVSSSTTDKTLSALVRDSADPKLAVASEPAVACRSFTIAPQVPSLNRQLAAETLLEPLAAGPPPPGNGTLVDAEDLGGLGPRPAVVEHQA